ncbi:hypothetical protein Glove_120g119 [Diversispora epigaea]|uniref:Uncharacterized protein n=1 Tax=Diversispora epigaea TaxID=1348612 RepID=A0A397IZI1_9GLOM|nr:hypothetical protein Glove_120g119 [Diversispora epigaea]
MDYFDFYYYYLLRNNYNEFLKMFNIESVSAETVEKPNDDIPIYKALNYNLGFKESVYTFIISVDWSQPWLWAVISFHIITFFALIRLKNNSNALAIITFGLTFLAAFSKTINTFAHHHWRKFSRDDYFDQDGFFISMIFSFPILVNVIVGIVITLNEVLHLLRRVKIAQIKQQKAKLAISQESDKNK